MRIYRYLFREVMLSFLAVAFVLLLIFASGRFVKYLGEVAAGSFSGDVLFSIMLYRMPGFIELILPLAFFLGVMLTYGRLYVESEMIVLQACGFSKRRLLLYTQGPAVVVMLVVVLFTTWLTPLGWSHFYRIWNDPATFSGLSTIVAGSFKRLGDSGAVIYTSEINQQKTEMKDVFVVTSGQRGNQNELTLVKASEAKVVALGPYDRYIELYRGVEYSGEPGRLDFRASRYGEYGQRIEYSRKEVESVDSVEGMPTLAIAGSQDAREQAVFFWRVALPLVVPVIALIGLALSETSHRRGRYVKLLPGVIICILYIAALLGVRSALEKGKVPSGLAFFIVHLFFLLLGLLLLYWPELRARLRFGGELR